MKRSGMLIARLHFWTVIEMRCLAENKNSGGHCRKLYGDTCGRLVMAATKRLNVTVSNL